MNAHYEPGLRTLIRSARGDDLACGDSRQFPDAGMEALKGAGLVARPPLGVGEMPRLLTLLTKVGWGDLALARIYEGHVNALWLIQHYGAADQWERACAQARDGRIFGVWNTDDPKRPLTIADGRLTGAKNYASGADGVDFALITASTEAGRVMILSPMRGLPVDRNWWRPQGMRLSGSHIVDFTGLVLDDVEIIGAPDDYLAQPWFTGGAIRFAAAHVGGMHATHDAFVDHLAQTRRGDDPYQQHRLARSAMLVETGYLWLRRAAEAWVSAEASGSPASARELEATANATRLAVELAAMEILELAERGVGAAGFMERHPLERLTRDLRTYLRQPAPDQALALFGHAVASGAWSPGSTVDEQGGAS